MLYKTNVFAQHAVPLFILMAIPVTIHVNSFTNCSCDEGAWHRFCGAAEVGSIVQVLFVEQRPCVT